jgi:hypothetical protein
MVQRGDLTFLNSSLQDPSRPGEMRDCSNCLSGAHLRKFIIERNRPPFASFGGTDEVSLKIKFQSSHFFVLLSDC